MKRWAPLLLLLSALGCKAAEPPPGEEAELRLVRAEGGRFALELRNAGGPVRALQAELVIDGAGSFALEDAQPAAGLALDQVRVEMRGTNRAILFAGAKRAVLMPANGAAASFSLRALGDGDGQIRVKSARLASKSGTPIAVRYGPALSVR